MVVRSYESTDYYHILEILMILYTKIHLVIYSFMHVEEFSSKIQAFLPSQFNPCESVYRFNDIAPFSLSNVVHFAWLYSHCFNCLRIIKKVKWFWDTSNWQDQLVCHLIKSYHHSNISFPKFGCNSKLTIHFAFNLNINRVNTSDTERIESLSLCRRHFHITSRCMVAYSLHHVVCGHWNKSVIQFVWEGLRSIYIQWTFFLYQHSSCWLALNY